MDKILKSKISNKIANDMFKLGSTGSAIYCWPISSSIISDVFVDYFIPNLKEYIDSINGLEKHSFELRSYLLMFLNRKSTLEVQKKYFPKIINKLLLINKDITLTDSLELNSNMFNLKYSEDNFNFNTKEYYSVVFLLDNYGEIKYPIFRGIGFGIYTFSNKLYRYYFLDGDTYVLISEYIKKPEISFFGHVFDVEEIKKFVMFKNEKIIDSEEIIAEISKKIIDKKNNLHLKDDNERIKYVLDMFLFKYNFKYPKELDFTKYLELNPIQNAKSFIDQKERVIKSTNNYIYSLLGDN